MYIGLLPTEWIDRRGSATWSFDEYICVCVCGGDLSKWVIKLMRRYMRWFDWRGLLMNSGDDGGERMAI